MPQHDDEVNNERMPVMPRIHDPEMRPPQQVQSDIVEPDVVHQEQPNVTKSFVEKSKGLFTSAMDNKLIVFIIVLVVIIIGVIAYFLINKNSTSETQTPKHSFLERFKRNKPDEPPPVVVEEPPPAAVKAPKTMSHDDIMNMDTDHLEELKRQRSTSAGSVSAVPEKKEFDLNEYMKDEASAPIEDDSDESDTSTQSPLATVATVLYPNDRPKVSVIDDEPETKNQVHSKHLKVSEVQPENSQPEPPTRQQSIAPTVEFTDNTEFDDAFSAAIMDSAGVSDDEEQSEVVNVQPPSVGGCTQLLKTGNYCKNKAKEGNRCHLHL